jgi:hypothetical protein
VLFAHSENAIDTNVAVQLETMTAADEKDEDRGDRGADP